MAKPKLRKFDAANYLKSEKDIALYLEACLKEGGDDPAFIAAALGDIARVRRAGQGCRAMAVDGGDMVEIPELLQAPKRRAT